MNILLWVGGWFFGYWFFEMMTGVLTLYGMAHGIDVKEPNQYLILMAWTLVWAWFCWKFVRDRR